MSRWTILIVTLMMTGWSCSCEPALVCSESADCSVGSVCLEGLCLTACNNDCDCADGYACGPVGACIPGVSQCKGNQLPLCGGADLSSDPNNCGACGRRCVYPNAFGQCAERSCQLARCKPGFFDIDGQSANGCEYSCTIDLAQPEETCDGRDNDCDGLVDEGLELVWYRDQDRDGVGTAEVEVRACLRPEGFVSTSGDCDDTDAQRAPGLDEVCDNKDNDCDDTIDEEALRPYYVDADGDGYGDPDRATIRCAPLEGEVADGTDCDDEDDDRHPGKLEVCDEVDNNCTDGLSDEPYLNFYLDQDGDGYGRNDSLIKACRRPENYALDSGDCNDASNQDHPGANERCDGLDNNCDDQVDEGLALLALYPDQDGDGFGAQNGQMTQACLGTPNLAEGQTDCDDADPSRYPGAPEWCDGVDQNCDQTIDNNLSIRSSAAATLSTLLGSASQLRADPSEVRWLDQVPGSDQHSVMRRAFDAQQSEVFTGAGDITPLTLNDYGQSSALLGASQDRCRLSVGGGAWQVVGPQGCRPLAVCPPAQVGAQVDWTVVLGVSDQAQETAALYTIDHQGSAQLISNLGTADAVTYAACSEQTFLALALERDAKDTVYAGRQLVTELRRYDSRLVGLDLLATGANDALLTLSFADGVIELEQVSAAGTSLVRRTAVGAPKQAGVARLIPAPQGAVLTYPILAPAFERGVWAVPVAVDTSAAGAEHRINQDAISQTQTTATPSATPGLGHLFYIDAQGLRRVFLGCAPP